jgi:hypothetical protein
MNKIKLSLTVICLFTIYMISITIAEIHFYSKETEEKINNITNCKDASITGGIFIMNVSDIVFSLYCCILVCVLFNECNELSDIENCHIYSIIPIYLYQVISIIIWGFHYLIYKPCFDFIKDNFINLGIIMLVHFIVGCMILMATIIVIYFNRLRECCKRCRFYRNDSVNTYTEIFKYSQDDKSYATIEIIHENK